MLNRTGLPRIVRHPVSHKTTMTTEKISLKTHQTAVVSQSNLGEFHQAALLGSQVSQKSVCVEPPVAILAISMPDFFWTAQ